MTTPDRWHEITAVFHAALARDPATRDAFLNDACKHDPTLRAEVDALLAAHHEAGSFGNTPVALPQAIERLAPGTRLGAFRIDALLGVGGMGEVYRATDTRLGRAVAIKVLPDAVARDPERLARLEREARLLAALNHPHIAAIYGIEEADAIRALVLELVEGETLAQQLRRQGALRFPGSSETMRVNEALVIATQIAEALEAAHDKGIIHRDLKPANIAITRDGGIVKILDFGIAKVVEDKVSDGSQPMTPIDETREGMVVGTARYMSPEQARGLAVDKRTDIWAFGCVLYELLTRQPAFSGATLTHTVAAILEREPDWSALPSATPVHIRRLLRRALEKNPTLRLRDIGDARIELLSGTATSEPAHDTRRSGLPRRFVYASAAALAGVAIAMFLLGRHSATGRQNVVVTAAAPVFRQLTFRRGVVHAARFAADGKNIVYSASWDGLQPELFTSNVDGPESRTFGWPDSMLMAVSTRNEIALGMRCTGDIAYGVCSRGTLARAPLAGGAPRELSTDIKLADWGANGELVVVRRQGDIDRVEFPQGRTVHENRDIVHLRVDPHGRRVALVSAQGSRGLEVYVIERDGTKRTLSNTWRAVSGIAWSPSGDELWFSGMRARLAVLNAVTLDGRERLVMRMPGSLSCTTSTATARCFLARVTEHDITMIKPPNRNSEQPSSVFDSAWGTGLSTDGKLLLVTERGEAVGTTHTMYLKPTDGARAAVRLGEGVGIALSDDAAWVLAIRSMSSNRQLVVVPTGAGDAIVLPRGGIEMYEYPTERSFQEHGVCCSTGRGLVKDFARLCRTYPPGSRGPSLPIWPTSHEA